jgi:uncharacterized protein (DUF952 family)
VELPVNDELPPRIYHLALRTEWQEAIEAGRPYSRSTLGKSLDEVGFIHCSLPAQVQAIADLVYAGRDDVVLVTIDPSRLSCTVRLENPVGGRERFPHIYGELDPDAVIAVDAVPLGPDGRISLRELISIDD